MSGLVKRFEAVIAFLRRLFDRQIDTAWRLLSDTGSDQRSPQTVVPSFSGRLFD
jgi:hypothetical protein